MVLWFEVSFGDDFYHREQRSLIGRSFPRACAPDRPRSMAAHLEHNGRAGPPMVGRPSPPKVFSVCPNCDKEVPTSNLPVHAAHCGRHFFRCKACDVLLPAHEKEAHLAEAVQTPAALLASLGRGDTSAVRRALAHGAPLEPSLALEAAGSGDASLVECAIARDGDAVARLRDAATGITMLHRAARSGSVVVAEVLLSHGADPLATTTMGDSPLQVSHGDAMKLLLVAHGAQIERLPLGAVRRAEDAPPMQHQGVLTQPALLRRSSSHRRGLVESMRSTVEAVRQDAVSPLGPPARSLTTTRTMSAAGPLPGTLQSARRR